MSPVRGQISCFVRSLLEIARLISDVLITTEIIDEVPFEVSCALLKLRTDLERWGETDNIDESAFGAIEAGFNKVFDCVFYVVYGKVKGILAKREAGRRKAGYKDAIRRLSGFVR